MDDGTIPNTANVFASRTSASFAVSSSLLRIIRMAHRACSCAIC